jgi:hypothetical protein
MQFLNPLLLWGVAGISVPIIIHLLNRYRWRPVEWAAMELLRRAMIVRARRVQIEDLILLALRCLAVALIALALSRPTLVPEGALSGEGADIGAVIAVDASLSMEHRPGVKSRFEAAAERAREIFRTLRPGNPVTLVMLGQRPRVLLRNVGFEADRLEQALKQAAPLPEALDTDICLRELADLSRELKAAGREVHIISDAQAATWGRSGEAGKLLLQQLAADARVFFLPVGTPQAENLAVTRLEFQSGTVRRGSVARYVAEVANNGSQTREQVTVSLSLGDSVVDRKVIERIDAGRTAAVPLFVRFEAEGVSRLTARVGRDELESDNARHAVADVRPAVRVLLVDGAPSPEPFKGAADFVAAALAPRADDASAPRIERVAWLDLASKRLADYQIVVLANVPDVVEEIAEALRQFVDGGGGLVMFTGDNVAPAVWNARFRAGRTPLIPGEIAEPVGEVSERSEGRALEAVAEGHPLTRALAAMPPELAADARVYRVAGLKPAASARVLLRTAGGGDPVLAEMPLGRGRVLLFTTSADRSWTNLPTHPLFPILLNEAVTYLLRQAHERPLRVGEPLSVPLTDAGDAAKARVVTVLDPAGKETAVEPVRREGRLLAELPSADRTGFYEFRVSGAESVAVAVNPDPRESDVRVLPPPALTEAVSVPNLRIVPEADDLAVAVREGRIGRELWRELLIAGLIVLAVEAALAWWFSRRRAE